MGLTVSTEPQCLYKGDLYLTLLVFLAWLFFKLIHALFKVLLFMCAGGVIHPVGGLSNYSFYT